MNMNRTVTYTTPQLCHYDYNLNRPWFVWFDITNQVTGETVRKQFRGDINGFKTKKERIAEGNALADYWQKELEDGWSPFKNEVPVLKNMTLEAAIDFAFSKCKLAKKSMSCYKTTVERFKKAGKALRIIGLPLKMIERKHIKLILDKMLIDNKLSNSAYNKYLGYIKAVLSKLVEYEVIENNPCTSIKTLKVAETFKYVPYTEEEKKKIRDHLFINYYRYFILLMVIYHTGIRPKEVLALKIKDIDFKKKKITIIPDIEAENSKTLKVRKIPVNKHLMLFFREMELENYPPSYYVFGSPYKSGQGNRGSKPKGLSGVEHYDYFKPSEVKIKRDTITRLWNKAVRKELKIDKYQYAMKHTGANEKIMAGLDVDALVELYGHSSKLMTRKYITDIQEINAKKIIELSPDFLK